MQNNTTQIIQPVLSSVGFSVQRFLPSFKIRSIGPFVFMDAMGPAEFLSNSTLGDILPHPHIGLATLTYLFSGAMEHRDSLGSHNIIRPKEVNLMNAASGIVHSERIPKEVRDQKATLQGAQFWLALPEEAEEGAPSFEHFAENILPKFRTDHYKGEVLLGQFHQHKAPTAFFYPALLMRVEIEKDGRLPIERTYDELAIYLLSGELTAASASSKFELKSGSMLAWNKQEDWVLKASQKSEVLIFGGDRLEKPRFIEWNFVSTKREKIDEAKIKWVLGQFPMIEGEEGFIQLRRP